MARILLGVTGGIAAYKALQYSRLAIKSGHSLRVVQTPDSERFVGAASFAGITGAPVLTSQFEVDPAGGVFPDQVRPPHDPISHLALVANCDVYVIAPATANTIAKLAAGLADNMVTALALSCSKPVLLAPAMNNEMYLNAATLANIRTLRERGMTVLEPATGELASKDEFGVGRLPEPAELLTQTELLLGGEPRLAGQRLLITTGGTREPIDDVRYVGNRSSGKMGFAIAERALAAGAEVSVIAANVNLPRNPAITYIDVSTAAQLESAVRAALPAASVLVMAAAVADFRPVKTAGKIKKDNRKTLDLQLEATNDVLAGLHDLRRPDQLVVGFAAESGGDLVAEAERKLSAKQLDLIIANDISDPAVGFEVDRNEVTIISRDLPPLQPPRGTKSAVAQVIVDSIAQLIENRSPAH